MTKVERELLAECRMIANVESMQLLDVIRDAHKFWAGPGRLINPRGWVARAAAAARLVARIDAAGTIVGPGVT